MRASVRKPPEAREALAETGFDPVYGARPIKRAIQQRVLDPLAMKVLEGGFVEGDTIEVHAEDGEIVFKAVHRKENEEENTAESFVTSLS